MSAIHPDLADASVFITGGGSGIGASVTEAFLRQGARVAFVQRSDASAFCNEMEERKGHRPLFIQRDVTDLEAVARVADASGWLALSPKTDPASGAAP